MHLGVFDLVWMWKSGPTIMQFLLTLLDMFLHIAISHICKHFLDMEQNAVGFKRQNSKMTNFLPAKF